MLKRWPLTTGLLALGLLGWMLHSSLTGDDDAKQVAPIRPGAAAMPCLKQPEHWSALPKLVAGNELALSRFLRFETPDGRTINARMFLTEFHPQRIDFGDDLPPDLLERRQTMPARMACIGHEITADEGFEPDFDVPLQFVKLAGPCAYLVNLGSVECFIRTTARPAQ